MNSTERRSTVTAYLVTAIDVHDPETYAKYREKAVAALEPFNKKSLVKSPLDEAPVVYEGTSPGHVVVMEFDSMEDIDRFYNSPEYQEALKYRQAAATTHYLMAMNPRNWP
jgi:uncharacterized protein (DUF1330 family)